MYLLHSYNSEKVVNYLLKRYSTFFGSEEVLKTVFIKMRPVDIKSTSSVPKKSGLTLINFCLKVIQYCG